jgi:hypothetical protein
MTVLNDILIERQRQLAKGFTSDSDDHNTDGSMTVCAMRILQKVPSQDLQPWANSRAQHVTEKHTPRQRLIIAAALIVAEVERLDRIAGKRRNGIPDVPRKRFFLRNVDSGECAMYCGSEDDLDEAAMAVRHIVRPELDEMLVGETESIDFELTIKSMTPSEVDALPDM